MIVSQEHAVTPAGKLERRDLVHVLGGPGVDDVQGLPLDDVEVLAVGLDHVGLVDPDLLHVGVGEVSGGLG